MSRVIAVTSDKGGVGKSTLAFNLAGALAEDSAVVLIDEDSRIHSCLDWAAAAPSSLPFQVVSPNDFKLSSDLDYLVIDTEGRPSMADMVALTKESQLVLVPCGPSAMEIKASIALWKNLKLNSAHMGSVKIVVTKVPPVGSIGQQARDAMRSIGISVCDNVVRTYAAHQRAAELGVLVRDTGDERASLAWGDIQALAIEVRE